MTLPISRVIPKSEIGDSRIDHGRIGTPIMNKNICSVDGNFSVRSDVGEENKLDTSVQQSPTNESNTESPRIEEESQKSVFYKLFEESNSSERMNLTNSLGIQTPKLVHFGHPSIETENVCDLLGGIVATRIENYDGIWRLTERDDMMAHAHAIETISEKIAYPKHVRDSEIETKNDFER